MRTLATLSLLVLAALSAAASAAQEVGARLAAGLERALAVPHADSAGRAARLAPMVDATHDLDALAAALFGDVGDDWSAEERAELTAALRGLVLASWAARLEPEGDALTIATEAGEGSVALTITPEGGKPARVVCTLGGEGARVTDVRFGSTGLVRELRTALAAELAAGDAQVLRAALDARAARHVMTPVEVVQELERGLIEVMKAAAASLDFAGRYELLAPLVDDTHDLESVAKLVVSRKWRGLSAEQRAALTRTFRELSIATYAARFDGFSGERFEGAREERTARSVMVKSRLVTGAGKEHQFDYLMRLDGGRWMIVNITVDGVSDLALKRQEYGAVIDERGFDALLEKLEAEIQRYRAGGKD